MHLPKPLCLNVSSLTPAEALRKRKGHLSWSGYAVAIALFAPFSVSLPSQAQDIPLYSSQFTDTQTHWANVCIEGLGAEGLMKGYPDGSFKPDGTITRAEFAAVMIKAFPDALKVRKTPNFSDVGAGFWGRSAIATAYQIGFLSGYPDNTFKPNQAITRAQAMVVIANAQQLSPGEMTTEKVIPACSSTLRTPQRFLIMPKA
ncbi:MAG: hypothetical protein DCF25_21540 [Leptolyngbya foveolarum]|uniref:SLH domain-containing protein n=1 Tax=Leptolyngbya foveolarum TaxID=47253 RepID=A0A2W4TR91_9CYAN|nr:MAG: hypothetical protein DCF25_21540 [Leptolyngbya foveolarum]